MDKLAFDIGVVDGIEKTAISRDTATRAMVAHGKRFMDAPDAKTQIAAGQRAMKYTKRHLSWLKGRPARLKALNQEGM